MLQWFSNVLRKALMVSENNPLPVKLMGGGGDMNNPMTTEGDLIVGDTGGAPLRLPVGTNGQVLTSNGTTAVWVDGLRVPNVTPGYGGLVVDFAGGMATQAVLGINQLTAFANLIPNRVSVAIGFETGYAEPSTTPDLVSEAYIQWQPDDASGYFRRSFFAAWNETTKKPISTRISAGAGAAEGIQFYTNANALANSTAGQFGDLRAALHSTNFATWTAFNGVALGTNDTAPVARLNVGLLVTGQATYKGHVQIYSGNTDAADNGLEWHIADTGSGYGYRMPTVGANLLFQSRQNSAAWTGLGGWMGATGYLGIGTVTEADITERLTVAGNALFRGTGFGQGSMIASAGNPIFGSALYLALDLGASQGAIRLVSSAFNFGAGGASNMALQYATNDQAYGSSPNTLTYVTALAIDGQTGAVQIGGGLTVPTMTGTALLIKNLSAAPSTNPVGGGVAYCEAGALKYRGTSGTVTTLAPA